MVALRPVVSVVIRCPTVPNRAVARCRSPSVFVRALFSRRIVDRLQPSRCLAGRGIAGDCRAPAVWPFQRVPELGGSGRAHQCVDLQGCRRVDSISPDLCRPTYCCRALGAVELSVAGLGPILPPAGSGGCHPGPASRVDPLPPTVNQSFRPPAVGPPSMCPIQLSASNCRSAWQRPRCLATGSPGDVRAPSGRGLPAAGIGF